MKGEEILEMAEKVEQIRRLAEELLASEIPAVKRNAKRLLASVRMLELNIVDLKDLS